MMLNLNSSRRLNCPSTSEIEIILSNMELIFLNLNLKMF